MAEKLIQSYPDCVSGYDGQYIMMKNGLKLLFDDGIRYKSHEQILNTPSIFDMLNCRYLKGHIFEPKINDDPGRARNEAFMKAMYGQNKGEVQKNLTTIVWCPKLVNIRLSITKVNGVDKQLKKVSDELDRHPELKKYLINATTFNWRIIKGTNRLSTHSFGTSIDLNIKYSNYWQWDCRCTDENKKVNYKNQIPQTIVDVFEKYGFIWGGRWYHYDTMHFEYRPELLTD